MSTDKKMKVIDESEIKLALDMLYSKALTESWKDKSLKLDKTGSIKKLTAVGDWIAGNKKSSLKKLGDELKVDEMEAELFKTLEE